MTVEQWLGEDNKIGIDIWHKKYQQNNESFEEWLDRISAGNNYIKELIKEKKFLFGGRILANRGLTNKKISYSNCYVITPPEDNLESIYDTCKKLARTFSYGGGCGIDISNLAPKGAKVNNAAKTSSGAASFMDTFSQVTGQIGQSGRRGALMISMDCSHPDIEDFIDAKLDLDKINYANISVRVSDDFMESVEEDRDWTLKFTREETHDEITKVIKAKELFHKLAENNWNMAEPGILYWDRIQDWNLLSNVPNFSYAGTNPCAEEPLPAGGSCLLGSLNLSELVETNINNETYFNFEELQRVVRISVAALNEVLDEGLLLHPLQEQRESVGEWRQIGLGIMGLADMLIKLHIKYDSPEAIELCNKIGKIMINEALFASANLSIIKGSYSQYDYNYLMNNNFFNTNATKEVKSYVKEHGLRNSQLLTIAPTGTLSTMLGISGGIEPIFANYYERTTKSLHDKDVSYKIYTPIVKKYMEENNLLNDKELPDYFITAPQISVIDRIKMQSTWQKYIDASISSTVNLPNETSVDEIEELYLLAWEHGLKGITVYRDGCKRAGILTTSKKETEAKNQVEEHQGSQRGDIVQVSNDVIGLKRKLQTGCGSLHCTAFFDPLTGQLMETYLSKGSTGGCQNFMIGLSRMISLAARAGVGIDDIIDQLNSCGTCPSYAIRTATKHDTSKGSCCPIAVGHALKEMYIEMQEYIGTEKKTALTKCVNNKVSTSLSNEDKCPQCGEKMIREIGCNTCKFCGYSKCD